MRKVSLTQMVAKLFRETANNLDAGNSELSDAEAMDLVEVFCHKPISKDTACRYLNMSRSKFDSLVREKKLPKGRKRIGFKELIWYKDELDACTKIMNNNN